MCESALNGAIRNGHVKIAKLLITKSNDTLDCPTFGGNVPLMTAVMYNQTVIFKILYEAGAKLLQRCHIMQNVNLTYRYLMADQYFHNITITSTRFKQSCPPYGGVEHLDAIYDNLDIIRFTHD